MRKKLLFFRKSVAWGQTKILVSMFSGKGNCRRRCCGEVNLSDFCRYYQQPTNNTPELALRIGSRLQELPQLLLLQLCCQYSANAMRSDEDSLRSLTGITKFVSFRKVLRNSKPITESKQLF